MQQKKRRDKAAVPDVDRAGLPSNLAPGRPLEDLNRKVLRHIHREETSPFTQRHALTVWSLVLLGVGAGGAVGLISLYDVAPAGRGPLFEQLAGLLCAVVLAGCLFYGGAARIEKYLIEAFLNSKDR